jgi:predicted MFS family arabinose efflux permease
VTFSGIVSGVAAVSTSIDGVILGRVLQGGGAIGSVILALIADLTSEENRTQAMAMVGITIGVSFMVALVIGPILAGMVGVSGIFWLMVGLAAVGIAITAFIVPHPRSFRVHRDTEAVPAMFRSVLQNRELQRLDFGIFALHAMLTASFLVVPSVLHERLNVNNHSQWIVYLPVLLLSVIVMVPAIIAAEKYRRMKAVFLGAIAALAVSQFMLVIGRENIYIVLAGISLFFAGFNVMEATLPSLVTKTAPPAARGTASGIYSSSQFLGIFVGGVLGGWVHQSAGGGGVLACTGALALIWLLVAVQMKQPGHLTVRLIRIGGSVDSEALAAKLRQVRGVAEVVVIAEEGLAYLKVDSKIFDAALAQSLV